MQEIAHTKHKIIQTASLQKDGNCIGVSNDKYIRKKTNCRQKLRGKEVLPWNGRDKCHWGFKHGLLAPSITLLPSLS